MKFALKIGSFFGKVKTNVTGVCGECSQCLSHAGFAPLMASVLSQSTLLMLQVDLPGTV